MNQRMSTVVLLMLAWPALAQDDFRVIKLEQDVHNLEREVGELQRQVADLQRQLAGATAQPFGSRPAPPPSQATAWLVADNWKRVEPGMSELDVIGILGVPTTTRVEEGARVLLYAIEIGGSGMLGGRVEMRDGRVTAVAQPRLK